MSSVLKNSQKQERKRLIDYTDRRIRSDTVRRQLAEHRRKCRRRRKRYRGGLPLEQKAHRELRAVDRRKRRAIIARGRGRRIDLVSILKQKAQVGNSIRPRWTIVDPAISDRSDASNYFGRDYDSEGARYVQGIRIGGKLRAFACWTMATREHAVVPAGVPAIPPKARAILTDPQIRRDAEWIGVLYEPEGWREVRPDPAVVVEWKDAPGEYYALAIWGPDLPRLMEWVS